MTPIAEVIAALGQRDLLSIRREVVPDDVADTVRSGPLIIDRLQSERLQFLAFRVLFARHGVRTALRELAAVSNRVPLEQYVAIGSFLAQAVGDYDTQHAFLDLASDRRFGWIARERIRNLVARNRPGQAVEETLSLASLNPTLHGDFCIEVLWQTNEWARVLSVHDEVGSRGGSAVACARYSVAHERDMARFPVIYSIYNPYTSSQIDLQEAVFAKSQVRLERSLGIPADRLPEAVFRQLSEGERGALGAALAHLRTLEDFLQSGHDFCFVTESDAFLRGLVDYPALEHALGGAGWDFVLCADRHASPADDAPISEEISPYAFRGRASGFDGYGLTSRCAEAIVARFSGAIHRSHIDGEVIKWLCRSSPFSVGVVREPVFGQSHLSRYSTRVKLELDY